MASSRNIGINNLLGLAVVRGYTPRLGGDIDGNCPALPDSVALALAQFVEPVGTFARWRCWCKRSCVHPRREAHDQHYPQSRRYIVARNSDLRSYLPSQQKAKRGGGFLAAGALALAGTAFIVNRRSAAAERSHPPQGSFVTSKGARLHYLEHGSGPPVVFLHGNGVMADDMLISRVFDQTARSCRAIAFDRPGFGYSERPRGHSWTAAAQAALLPRAFALLGIDRPIVVGHSSGTMVALALALDHPEHVSGLVLASGYYYPTARADVVLFSPPAIPLLGDLLCYTVAPLIGEALAPRMFKKMFAPQPVPPRFEEQFPVGLTLRPSQVRAVSEDASNMVTDAKALSERYNELSCPVAILAGDADGVVKYQEQALRLHRELSDSTLDIFTGVGHMIHHADPDRVVRAIKGLSTSHSIQGREDSLAVVV
jgi:pimeloyl-ACP methyl ester carboxylesterase